MKLFSTNGFFRLIYIALLLSLLEHTAWAFGSFEADGKLWGGIAPFGWVAALAFEGAIYAFTYKLSENISRIPARVKGWKRFKERYLNAYSVGLLLATAISAIANWMHAVQFGGDLVVVADGHISRWFLTVAFGGILPVMSLMFATVLAKDVEYSEEQDEEKENLRRELREVRRELSKTAKERDETNKRFGEVSGLFAEEKADRILAAKKIWPKLNNSAVSVVANASASYVSETLKAELSGSNNQRNGHGEGVG